MINKHLYKCAWPAFPKQHDLVCYSGLPILALIILALGIMYHANQGVTEIIWVNWGPDRCRGLSKAIQQLREKGKTRTQLFRLCSHFPFWFWFLNIKIAFECKLMKANLFVSSVCPTGDVSKVDTPRVLSKYCLFPMRPKLDLYK